MSRHPISTKLQPVPRENDITSSQNPSMKSFLALVPRGLEHSIMSQIRASNPRVIISAVGSQRDRQWEETGNYARDVLVATQQAKNISNSPWFRHPVGTVQMVNEHMSVGYDTERSCTWSVPGALEGLVWLRIDTAEDVEFILNLRCLGPLLALISSEEGVSSIQRPDHTLEDAISDTSNWLESRKEEYATRWETAFALWKESVSHSWKGMLSPSDFDGVQERIQSGAVRFRMSCMRDHEEASYARQDYLKTLLDQYGPTVLPPVDKDQWKVNLKQFDFEFVAVLLSTGYMAMCISLNPYPFYNAKGFYNGCIPPDISNPYIGHENLQGLVRLRPTTASMLLRFAELNPYETVIDPCAGVGTIPIEVDVFHENRCIGFGGDIVLDHPNLASAASGMEQAARGSKASASMLAAWDACFLPLRPACMDVLISDLPFGKQCLSSNALKQLLPILFLEFARVLVPSSGRMVILCGSPSITDSLAESVNYWTTPCTIATPVTIGGLQAWIFRIERNETTFDQANHPTYLEQVRAQARRRDRISKHRSSKKNAVNMSIKKRRIQA